MMMKIVANAAPIATPIHTKLEILWDVSSAESMVDKIVTLIIVTNEVETAFEIAGGVAVGTIVGPKMAIILQLSVCIIFSILFVPVSVIEVIGLDVEQVMFSLQLPSTQVTNILEPLHL